MSEQGSGTGILRLYHRRSLEMLEGFAGQPDEGRLPLQMRSKVLLELVRHEVVETMFLYPTVLDVLPQSEAIVEYGLAELTHIHELMQAVEAIPPDDLRFEERARQLSGHLRQHAEDQETSLFPRLEEAMSAEDLRRLGMRITPTAASGATQSHPNVGEDQASFYSPRPGLIDDLRSQVVTSQLTM